MPHDFDASCTTDADGHEIVLFEWDLDGVGTFERDSGSSPSVTHTYASRAAHFDASVAFNVRATDSAGEHAIASLTLSIVDDLNSWFTFGPELVNPGDVLELEASVLPSAPGASSLPPGPSVLPTGPEAPAFEPTEAAPPKPQLRRPRLKRLDGDKHGLTLVYTGGPRWSRYRMVVKLPADRAASYGLPRRTVVFARGYLNFNSRGVGRTRLRWTKGAYDVFRRVRMSLLDIRGRRVKV